MLVLLLHVLVVVGRVGLVAGAAWRQLPLQLPQAS
jgi:hypothetical protein